MKTALITGITGQDGSYLAELLLSQGYEVHGLIRRASTFNTRRIDHLYHDPHGNGDLPKLFLHYGDMGATDTLLDVIYTTKPDEIYHLAAQSHVRVSFDMPEYTGNITGIGTTRILEAIRKSGLKRAFIRLLPVSFLGMPNHRKMRKRLSTRAARMLQPSCMPIGWQTTIVKLMACIPLMVFFSTMSHRAGGRPL